jgi:hypothetical protein
VDYDFRMSKNAPAGTAAGDNKAVAGTWSTNDAYVSYGGSSDLWGQTWSADEVNSSNFGPLIKCEFTWYHYSHSYGFAIPAGATVDGILLEVERSRSGTQARIDHIRITVYYTEATGHPAQRRLGMIGGGRFRPVEIGREGTRFFRRDSGLYLPQPLFGKL